MVRDLNNKPNKIYCVFITGDSELFKPLWLCGCIFINSSLWFIFISQSIPLKYSLAELYLIKQSWHVQNITCNFTESKLSCKV